MKQPYLINKKFSENLFKLLDEYTNELILLSETGADALRIARALEQESSNFPKNFVLWTSMSMVARDLVQSKINKRPLR